MRTVPPLMRALMVVSPWQVKRRRFRGTHRVRVRALLVWYLNRDHAWFAGFAPASRPLVSIVVLVEHGGAGGRTAAPIGTRILQEYGDDVEASESEAGAE